MWKNALTFILYMIPFVATLFGTEWSLGIRMSVFLAGAVVAFFTSFAEPLRRFTFPVPWKDKREKDELDTLIRFQLGQIKQAYLSLLGIQNNAQLPVRLNIMLLKRQPFYRGWKRYLSIEFAHGPYEDEEYEQEYLPGQACCGMAIQKNDYITYDRKNQHQTENNMTATQRKVTEQIFSMVSVPIYRREDRNQSKPIGVLNIDSTEYITDTEFDQDHVADLLQSFGAIVECMLR